jgi:hypothetical protein
MPGERFHLPHSCSMLVHNMGGEVGKKKVLKELTPLHPKKVMMRKKKCQHFLGKIVFIVG